MNAATALGLVYVLSELGLGIKKRSKSNEARDGDRGSLMLLWLVIVPCVVLAFSMPHWLPSAQLRPVRAWSFAGILIFVAGLAIRWYAIVHLGRFFTVNVAIAADHRLIDTGPYRWVRHPSYTGALMAFLGLALCLANWASVLMMVLPIFTVFRWRMQVEEEALLRAFKDRYRQYMKGTKRLIPSVY